MPSIVWKRPETRAAIARPMKSFLSLCSSFLLSILFILPAADAVEFHITGSATLSHDSNTRLDSSKKSDLFASQDINIHVKHPLSNTVNWVSKYHVFNTNYFEATDINNFYQTAKTGLDKKITDRSYINGSYIFSSLSFPNDENGDTISHGGEVALRTYLNRDVRFKNGFRYSFSDFTNRRIHLGSGDLSLGDNRADDGYTVFSRVDWKIQPNAQLHLGYRFFFNESNDEYLDFYDYQSHRIRAGLTLRPHAKVILHGSFTYEFKDYASRTLFVDPTTEQEDDAYTIHAGVRYRWYKNVAVGYSFLWRQKDSNEPTQEYNNIIQTLGIYFKF